MRKLKIKKRETKIEDSGSERERRRKGEKGREAGMPARTEL